MNKCMDKPLIIHTSSRAQFIGTGDPVIFFWMITHLLLGAVAWLGKKSHITIVIPHSLCGHYRAGGNLYYTTFSYLFAYWTSISFVLIINSTHSHKHVCLLDSRLRGNDREESQI